MHEAKLTIVADTNVWLSGIVFGGNPVRIIRLFVDGTVLAVTSEELLTELRRKVSQLFPLYEPYLGALIASIREQAMVVPLGTKSVNVSRDLDDNMVIETALLGGAGYIVSGDKDLLVLQEHQNVKIVKPADLLGIIG